jgi:hypothetical protein
MNGRDWMHQSCNIDQLRSNTALALSLHAAQDNLTGPASLPAASAALAVPAAPAPAAAAAGAGAAAASDVAGEALRACMLRESRQGWCVGTQLAACALHSMHPMFVSGVVAHTVAPMHKRKRTCSAALALADVEPTFLLAGAAAAPSPAAAAPAAAAVSLRARFFLLPPAASEGSEASAAAAASPCCLLPFCRFLGAASGPSACCCCCCCCCDGCWLLPSFCFCCGSCCLRRLAGGPPAAAAAAAGSSGGLGAGLRRCFVAGSSITSRLPCSSGWFASGGTVQSHNQTHSDTCSVTVWCLLQHITPSRAPLLPRGGSQLVR